MNESGARWFHHGSGPFMQEKEPSRVDSTSQDVRWTFQSCLTPQMSKKPWGVASGKGEKYVNLSCWGGCPELLNTCFSLTLRLLGDCRTPCPPSFFLAFLTCRRPWQWQVRMNLAVQLSACAAFSWIGMIMSSEFKNLKTWNQVSITPMNPIYSLLHTT